MEEVAAHLGHSTGATSWRFAHLSPDGLERAVRKTHPELQQGPSLRVSTQVSKSSEQLS